MPRKRKDGDSRRESSGKRWKRKQVTKARFQELGVDSSNRIRQRIELDSSEFTFLFRLEGGRDSIDSETIVRVFDGDGHKVKSSERRLVAIGSVEDRLLKMKIDGERLSAADKALVKGAVEVWEDGESRFYIVTDTAVAPRILGMDRGKVAVLAARWLDVEAIAEARERLREVKKQKQVADILAATDRQSFGWYRQEVPDQPKRSILVGSNNGKDPTSESDSLVVCYKETDGRYYLAEERWSGAWSAPDKDGYRERVNVVLDRLQIAFHDEEEAQRSFMLAAKSGDIPRFEERKDCRHKQSIAGRLRVWEHEGIDVKALYTRPPAEKRKKEESPVDVAIDVVREENGLPSLRKDAPRGKRVRIPHAG